MPGDKLFRPKEYPARKPTDTKKQHGSVINPPRMMEIGGADSLHKGHTKNTLTLRKPGGTR